MASRYRKHVEMERVGPTLAATAFSVPSVRLQSAFVQGRPPTPQATNHTARCRTDAPGPGAFSQALTWRGEVA
jgi:hypothetical protein